jgi:hypothetical protein
MIGCKSGSLPSVKHHSCAMKLLSLALIGSTVVLSSCSTTPKEDCAQIVEDEVLDERISLNILSALDSGDLDKTRKLAETPMLIDAATLPDYIANGHLRPGQKEAAVTYARKVLDYIERHKSELEARPQIVRPAVRGLQKTLTESEDVRRLQELSDYFTAADK